MRAPQKLLFASAILLNPVDGAMSQDRNYFDPDGAVLCSWTLYVYMHESAKWCGKIKDSPAAREIEHSIERMDDFIIVNEPTTRPELEHAKKEILRPLNAMGPPTPEQTLYCENPNGGTTLAMYNHLERQGAERIRGAIDKLLAKPRRPVMNPCL